MSIVGTDAPVGVAAEQALLGSWLADPGSLRRTLHLVAPDDFSSGRHERIALAVRSLADERKPVDVTSVAERLAAMGVLDAVGGISYLTDLLTGVVVPAHADHYASVVSGASTLRRLATVGRSIVSLTEPKPGETVDPAQAVAAAEALMAAVRRRGAEKAVWFANEVEAAWNAMLDPSATLPVGWPTGLRDLDSLIGGLRNGEMIVVGARPSHGKSALALYLSLRRAQSGQVLLVSLEMGREMLAQRAISLYTGLNGEHLRRRVYEPEELRPHEDKLSGVFGGLLQVMDTPGATTADVAAEAWRIEAQGGLDLVVVDYLTLLGDARGKQESRVEWTTRISGRLQRLARELNCPVLVLSQLNRSAEAREDKRPQLSDLRDSGAIEQDADLVLLLHRPGLYDPTGSTPKTLLEIEVAKQRNGPVGKCQVVFRPETGQFADIERTESEGGQPSSGVKSRGKRAAMGVASRPSQAST